MNVGGAPDIREDEELEEEEEEEMSEDDDEMADFIVDEEDVYELGSSSKYVLFILNQILYLQNAELLSIYMTCLTHFGSLLFLLSIDNFEMYVIGGKR